MVGARGFEPPTPCSRSRYATRLRHAPMVGNSKVKTGESQGKIALVLLLGKVLRSQSFHLLYSLLVIITPEDRRACDKRIGSGPGDVVNIIKGHTTINLKLDL